MKLADARRILKTHGANTLLSHRKSNPKIIKSDKMDVGYLTRIMHFAPAKLSGYEVCPGRSKGCTAACLHTAGGAHYFKLKEKVRIARTKCWFEDREAFKTVLTAELHNHVRYCEQKGHKPAVRLNGTSDIVWEKEWPELFDLFPTIQFYDYTKIVSRLSPKWNLPSNYYLTFSRSETVRSQADTMKALSWGHNVAVVFGGFGHSRFPKPLPASWQGYPVYDGDKHDLRFLDPAGHVIGLRGKGEAYQRDKSGFTVILPVLNNIAA